MLLRELGLTPALLFLALAAGAETVALRPEELPELVRRSEAARAAELEGAAAAARTGHLGRSWLPAARLEGGGERFTTRDEPARTQPYAGGELSLNVFRGGKDLLDERAREAESEAAGARARLRYAERLAEARRRYWSVAASSETAALLEAALARNERYQELAERRIRGGLATPTDRLEFQIQASQLREELDVVRADAAVSEAALAALLGAPAGTRFSVAAPVPHEHDEAPAARPEADGPLVRAAAAEGRAAAARASSARLWWAPEAELYGGYQLYTFRERELDDRRLRDDRFVGARVSLPLFDGLRGASESRARRRESEALGAAARQSERDFTAAVSAARTRLELLHRLIHVAEERIGQGREYERSVLDEYGRGVKNSLDLLAAGQKSLAFQRQHVERRRDYQLERAGLLALTGE